MTSGAVETRPPAVALAVAGSATIATAFGMARYGYGLLLPDIQGDLALGATALGAIGTLGYVAYMIATVAVARCVARFGERATVVLGGMFAIAGTVVVALASEAVVLAAGVAVAGASAGLVAPPFADAIAHLPSATRARTQATINCGTGWGVAVAAPIAIAAGNAWRAAYVGFAACAALSTVYAARTLPAGTVATPTRGERPRLRRQALPMIAGGVLVGLGSATFWTFAVDAARDAGLDQTTGRILLGVAGITSVLGIAAADVIRGLGARRTFVLTAALEAAAVATFAFAADRLPAVLTAAAAFGAAYNTIVTVTVLWAIRIYGDQPSAGVALAAGANAAGLLCGPLAGGIVADTLGLTGTLLGGAALVLAAAAFAPGRDLIHPATSRSVAQQRRSAHSGSS